MVETRELFPKILSRLLADTVKRRNTKKQLKRSIPINQERILLSTIQFTEEIRLMLT